MARRSRWRARQQPRRARRRKSRRDAQCRDRRGSPARDGVCLPGFARTGPRSPGRSCGRFPGCARSSSRRSACDWTACARERSCASGFRLRADERRCARPYGKSRRRKRSAAPRPRRGRSGRGQNNSGHRCRRDSRRRPWAGAIRCIHRLIRQRFQRRAVDLLEQLAAGDAGLAGAGFVELGHEFAERGVDVGEAG